MNNSGPRQGRPIGLAWVLGGAIITGVATWAIARYVVTDEDVVLEYLKVLIWPALVGVTLFWLRVPLRDKFGQLRRFEGFGASAQFSLEAQAQRLQIELGSDIDDLVGEDADDASSSVEDTDDPIQAEEDPVIVPSTSVATEPAPSMPISALMSIAEGLGISDAGLNDMRSALADPSRQHAALRTLQAHARKAGKARTRQVSRTQQSRDSVESVIRKSAAWGYEMGKVGAPEAVPDIEWSDDGGWRITTEVPAPRRVPGHTSQSHDHGADRERHIQSLEKEIKEIEKRTSSVFGSLATMGVSQTWLAELKRRLSSIDPDNPWALP